MAEPSGDPAVLKILLDWAWALCLGAVALVRKLTFDRLSEVEKRIEINRLETREQLYKLFDKIEELKTLIYERTDGDHHK